MKKIICILISLITLFSIANIASHATPNNVKQIVFDYLTNDMKLNKAAACGVMANIEYESDFNPTLVGDYGTSYGLCQWHNERWSNLKNYCNRNGYDWKSTNGQLHFLQYELEHNAVDTGNILNKLKNTENSASGAYNAAYNWCYYFERPANKSYESDKRGSRAQSYYWPNYNIMVKTPEQPDKEVYWVGVVTAETSLYIRKGPSIDSEPLTTIPYGTKVIVTAENGNWGKVTYNNITGYSYLPYIEKEDEFKTSSETTLTISNAITGDINKDSLINSNDVMLILNHIIGNDLLDKETSALADINHDNIVNSNDASILLNMIVSKTD